MPTMTSYRHGVPAWTDVSTTDIEGTGAFYCRVFGWEMTPDMGPDAGGYRLFMQGGLPVAGIGPNQGGPPSWTVYVNVTDADEVAGRIQSLGGVLAVPPMDLPNDSGRIAFGLDPTGGFFAIFQAGPNHFGAALVNEPCTVTWNELAARDVPAATAFYDALFGWSTASMDGSPMPYSLISVGGRAVAGAMEMDERFPPEVPTHWLTYFAVNSVQATVDACAAAGGSLVAAPFDTPVGVMAVLRDPTGAVFAIGAFTMIDDPNNWPA